jgi:ribose transport system substrate-binding protein
VSQLKWSKLLAVSFAAILAASACSSGATSAPSAAAPSAAAPSAAAPSAAAPSAAAPSVAAKKLHICHDEINLTIGFFVNMKKASEAIAAAYGVDVTWQSADGALEKQISIMENYITQKCDAIAIDPLNADALVDVINKAHAAGIPVVTMGNKVNATGNTNTLYPDYDNFVLQGNIMCEAVQGKGTVLFLIGSVGNFVSDTRQKGFEDAMKAKCPNVKVLVQPTNFDSSTATSITQTTLTSNPDLAGVASISDGLTLPALKVLEAKGKLGIPVVAMDGDPAVFPYIVKGQVLTDIITGDLRVGAWNTAVATRLAKGSTFPTDIFMPTYVITSADTAGKHAALKDIKWISTEDAAKVAMGSLEEFGPNQPDAAMNSAK